LKQYNISTCLSRQDKIYKQISVTWEDLVERLKTTSRTSETLGEYKNLPKSKQDDIKDVGGFVGGTLIDGIRRNTHLKRRCLLTLDVDFATVDFLDEFKMFNMNSYIVYSTHKHTEEHPRLRLIFPLSRECTGEEYEAVARNIANDIGINYFDDTTYQASRMMYFPSTSIDGDYVFESFKASDINVDEILNSYDNWQDVSQWATSEKTKKKHNTLLKKQENPTSKVGVVGTFCRLYDVYSVIDKYLYDIYDSVGDGRYTYINGSTTGGAVVYNDGLFLYSNHSTDPASGILCNAFDLLRIHMFGEQDFGITGKQRGNTLPSYIATQEFILKLDDVKLELHKERTESALSDFKGMDVSLDIDGEIDTSWTSKLALDNKGRVLPTIDNCLIILENDHNLKGKMKLNDFNHKRVIDGNLPWKRNGEHSIYWGDDDDKGLRHYIERLYNVNKKTAIDDAWGIATIKHKFNPIKDYLNGLTWDGEKRAETLFIDYLGASDNIYTRAVTRKILKAAISRVFNNDVKLDWMPVIVGQQGCGKTEILKRLGGDFYSDTLNSINDKNAYEQLQGVWILEIQELAPFKKATMNDIKAFLSKTEDNFRAAYGKHTEVKKRKCVFFGTTNDYTFLKDYTGNRRFKPIDVNPNNAKYKDWYEVLTKEVVDQIWAEMMVLYKVYEPLDLIEAELKEFEKMEHDKHLDISPLQGDIDNFLNMKIPKDWDKMELHSRRDYIQNGVEPVDAFTRQEVCVNEIWVEVFKGEKKDLTQKIARDIASCVLKGNQWERTGLMKTIKHYGVQKYFIRPDHKKLT